MRSSLVLLAVLAACSDSSGPRQIPVFTTELSPSVTVNHSLVFGVTLNATNPTDTTIQVPLSSVVFAEVEENGAWTAGSMPVDAFQAADTLVLPPRDLTTVGSVNVSFIFVPGEVLGVSADLSATEDFKLAPGTYKIRACVLPAADPSLPGLCGNGLKITVSQ